MNRRSAENAEDEEKRASCSLVVAGKMPALLQFSKWTRFTSKLNLAILGVPLRFLSVPLRLKKLRF